MKPPLNSSIINVCILPPDEISRQCVKISQSLRSSDMLFVLGDDKFPHLTVYMARFADRAVGDIIKVLGATLHSIPPVLCEHTGYFLTPGRYIEASYAKTSSIAQLHRMITKQLSAFRLNPGRPYEESYFAPYTKDQQRNAEMTGYDLAGELYRPHITLARYKAGRLPAEVPQLPKANLSFPLTQIGVYKADDNGAVFEALKIYNINTY